MLDYQVDSIISSKRKSKLAPEDLSQKWCIGLDTANKMLKCTTQSGMQNIFVPLDWKVQMKAQWLEYPSINVKMYGDAMHLKATGLSSKTSATILTNGKGFDHVYPWKTKNEYAKSLMKFIHNIGIHKTLVTNGASEMQKGKGREVADLHNVNLKVTVPYSPWQNLAEASVRECKSMMRWLMRCVHAPARTWTYAAKWVTALRCLTASSIPDLEGRTPTEHVTGSTPDITVYSLFQWYNHVYYHSPDASFPYQKQEMGRLLGVADNCTDELVFVILALSGNLLIWKSIWGVPPKTVNTDSVKADMLELDADIKHRFGDKTLQNWQWTSING